MRSLTYKQKQSSTIRSIAQPERFYSIKESFRGAKQVNLLKFAEMQKIRRAIQQQRNQGGLQKRQHAIFVVPHSSKESVSSTLKERIQQSQQNTCSAIKVKKIETKMVDSKQLLSHTEPFNFTKKIRGTQGLDFKLKKRQNKSSQQIMEESKGQTVSEDQERQNNLLQSIRGLRNLQKQFMAMNQQEIYHYFNKFQLKSNCSPSKSSPGKGDSRRSSSNPQKFNERAACLKQKIKLKLSRKHFYHSLKQKSEMINKVKYRSLHHSLKTIENETIQSLEQGGHNDLRLHQTLKKFNCRNMHLNQLKKYSFFVDISEPLRVESKQAYIERPKKSEQDNRSLKASINPKFNTFCCNKAFKDDSNNQSQSYMDQAIKLKSKASTFQIRKCCAKSEILNIFRQLTPWRSDEIE